VGERGSGQGHSPAKFRKMFRFASLLRALSRCGQESEGAWKKVVNIKNKTSFLITVAYRGRPAR
jgi:hypothetical protein